MLCQHCQKRIANVHFTKIINNKKVEMYLCEQCAKEKGQFSTGSPMSINDFLSGIIGIGSSTPFVDSLQPQKLMCEKCGMSFEEFQRIGKMGCDNCYEIYGERLKPLLRRLHGNSGHTGKVPAKVSRNIKKTKEIEELKDLLSKAVLSEEYEKAAELRDKIKSLEAGKVK